MKVIGSYIPHSAGCQISIPLLCLNRVRSILILVILSASFSCKKAPEPLFTDSVVVGTAELYQIWDNNAGIKVTATGPYGHKESMTNRDNSFSLSGLGNGTYILDFSRQDYGTIRKWGVQLFGHDTVNVGSVKLFKKNDKFVMPQFTQITTFQNSNNSIFIKTDLETYMQELPVIMFMDSLRTVSYRSNSLPCPTLRTLRRAGEDKIFLVFDTFGLPFRSGTEVFIIFYVCNPDELRSGIFDNYTGYEQLSTLIPGKHSEVMSFIMP